MSGIDREQMDAVQLDPGVRLERPLVVAKAQLQGRMQATPAQPSEYQQRLSKAGGLHRAMLAGNGREPGQVLGVGQVQWACRPWRRMPSEALDHAPGACVTAQCQPGMHQRQASGARHQVETITPRQGEPAGQPTTHLIRP